MKLEGRDILEFGGREGGMCWNGTSGEGRVNFETKRNWAGGKEPEARRDRKDKVDDEDLIVAAL